MSIEELVKATSKECADVAETCIKVGDPIFDDLFVDILERFVATIVEDTKF